MELSPTIPDNMIAPLPEAHDQNLNRAELERVALDGYRTGKLSRFQMQRLLGFDNRYDAEDWLGQHGAVSSYSLIDLDADRATLDSLLPR